MALMESGTGQVKGRMGLGVLRGLGQAVLDQLYPPGCACCGAPLLSEDGLCGRCFADLVPITAPYCPVLGLPFAADMGPGALSAEALADPPPFRRARAAAVYGEIAGALVSRLKYGDRPELARFCARQMARAGREFWDEAPVLVPVPLHASRLRWRRYNQSMLLAQALGRELSLKIEGHAVLRHRKTRQQVGLSGTGRARNVQGAFSLRPDALAALGGRNVVLIDDVYTTGATVRAVSRALLRGGVGAVDVLTFARVVIGDDLPI